MSKDSRVKIQFDDDVKAGLDRILDACPINMRQLVNALIKKSLDELKVLGMMDCEVMALADAVMRRIDAAQSGPNWPKVAQTGPTIDALSPQAVLPPLAGAVKEKESINKINKELVMSTADAVDVSAPVCEVVEDEETTPGKPPILTRSQIAELAEFYRNEACKSSAWKLTQARRQKLLTRAREGQFRGYDPADYIRKAILGCCLNPFNLGDNDRHTRYMELERHILCSEEQAEKRVSWYEENHEGKGIKRKFKTETRAVHVCPAAGCGEPLDYPGQRCPRCGQ